MDISVVDEMVIPMITIACLCIGYVMKKWLPTDDKWIPTVLLIIGAVSGVIVFGLNYEGVVKGMVSGLSSVGLHQVFKQHFKLEKIQDTFTSQLDAKEMLAEVEDYEDAEETTEE